ncbi:hypothetical protein DER46DRAFT_630894 [Fusarium sp. MPI-SDFR-AT-0072]|nr:hypothetical protein DER46DRAFT_630894 [Fusarium sp. MPI-SDFR-AT-0072]
MAYLKSVGRSSIPSSIPCSYDLIYAESRASQEKPGAGRWSAEDETSALSQFWAAVVRNTNQHCVQNKKGEAIPYFRNPQDLQESLALFRDTVLAGLDPTQIDMHSCCLDVGMRDHVCTSLTSLTGRSQNYHRREPLTLFWKSDCCHHLHDQIAKSTRMLNLCHPETRSPGVVRAKAHNCSKELFGVMFSDYQLNRSRVLDAWDANKRHMRAISSLKKTFQLWCSE